MKLKRIGIFEVIHTFLMRYFLHKRRSCYGHIGKNSFVHTPSICGYGQKNIFLGDNVNIDWDNVLYCDSAKFIMKDNSASAVGLTVVTGNHVKKAGVNYGQCDNSNLIGKDIIVEEDVWIAANVTLLAGAHIGRGAVIGAGSVIRNCNIPPYSVVMGNPAKVTGFKWQLQDIIEHEKTMYPEQARINEDVLRKNYQKYYLDRKEEIRQFVKL